MNLDLREIPAVYINLDQDVEKNESMKSMLDQCGFKHIIRVEVNIHQIVLLQMLNVSL